MRFFLTLKRLRPGEGSAGEIGGRGGHAGENYVKNGWRAISVVTKGDETLVGSGGVEEREGSAVEKKKNEGKKEEDTVRGWEAMAVRARERQRGGGRSRLRLIGKKIALARRR